MVEILSNIRKNMRFLLSLKNKSKSIIELNEFLSK